MTADTVSSESPERLRADLVAKLREWGSLRSPEVAEAFVKVPRDKFVPEAPLTAAYSVRDVVVTKRNAAGRATSSVSAPWLQAEMIEAGRLTRGARVLEVGSGGYNTALMAEIVGGRRLGLVGPTTIARRPRRALGTATGARLWAEAERLSGVTLPVPVA